MPSKRTPSIVRRARVVKRSVKKKTSPAKKAKRAKKASKKAAKVAKKATQGSLKRTARAVNPPARKAAKKTVIKKAVKKAVNRTVVARTRSKVAKKAVKKTAKKSAVKLQAAVKRIAAATRKTNAVKPKGIAKKTVTRKPARPVAVKQTRAIKKTVKKTVKRAVKKKVTRVVKKATTRRPVATPKITRKPAAKPKATAKTRKPRAIPVKKKIKRKLKRSELTLIKQMLAHERKARAIEKAALEQHIEAQNVELQIVRKIVTEGSRLRWKYIPANRLRRSMGEADYSTLTTGETADGFTLDPGVFESTNPGHVKALLRARLFGAHYSRLPEELKRKLNGEQAWLAQFYEAEQLNPDGNPMALVHWASKSLQIPARYLVTFILSPNLDEI